MYVGDILSFSLITPEKKLYSFSFLLIIFFILLIIKFFIFSILLPPKKY